MGHATSGESGGATRTRSWFSGVEVGRSQWSPAVGETRSTLLWWRPLPILSNPSPHWHSPALRAPPSPWGLPETGARPMQRGGQVGRGAGGRRQARAGAGGVADGGRGLAAGAAISARR